MRYILLFVLIFSGDLMAENLKAEIDTTKGKIELELFSSKVPLTVANFVNLATRGYYKDIKFHRVIANFMVQTGDPLGTGTGGPGYKFEDEFDDSLRHSGPGILSMANAGPKTNGSQFFITHLATPHLDGKHSVFGKVTSGQDIVNKIEQGDKINNVTISGDFQAVLDSKKDRVTEWNKILDQKYPKK